jgi:hypothetical protein
MVYEEVIAVYSKKRMEPINTLCGHKAELLVVKEYLDLRGMK